MTTTNWTEIAASYGVQESNNISDAAYNHTAVDHSITVYLDDPRLMSVDRVRFLSDADFPYWDLSYAYATICDMVEGKPALVHVRLDIGIRQVRKGQVWTALKKAAADAGLSLQQANDLGLLSKNVVSQLS